MNTKKNSKCEIVGANECNILKLYINAIIRYDLIIQNIFCRVSYEIQIVVKFFPVPERASISV